MLHVVIKAGLGRVIIEVKPLIWVQGLQEMRHLVDLINLSIPAFG